MGSAIGSGPGDLELVSVDASGQPNPGAIIDPGASGGPGTGRAIEAVAFPGEVVLFGFVLRSPDSHGLTVLLSGFGLTLDQLVANNNPGNGVVVVQDPDTPSEVLVRDLQADSNGGSGVALGADHITVMDVTARNNGEHGIALFGRLISGQRLVAEANTESGVAVAAVSNHEAGIFASADVLTTSVLTATANQRGILLLAEDRIEASRLNAVGNGGIGIGATAANVLLDEAVAENNVIGIVLGGASVELSGSTATGSGPAGDDPDGTGFMIAANRLDATDNVALGNVLGWRFEDTDPLATLLSDLPAELTTRLARLAPRGLPLAPQRLTLLRTRTEANLAASMEVRLRPEGAMQVACSNFLGNGQPGLDLQTTHTVDARSNFWGQVSGPSHPGNPGGTGDPIQDGNNGGFGTVLFAPFLTGPATDEDCPLAPVTEVPALGLPGVMLLVLLLAATAWRRLRA